MPPQITHVLFDFFGTLVDYQPALTAEAHHDSHTFVQSIGADVSYPEYLAVWQDVSSRFESRGAIDNREFTMNELGSGVLMALGLDEPAPAALQGLVERYLTEWNTCVTYPAGTAGVVSALAAQYRLAVVSNTNDTDLVPQHLTAMGIAEHFDAVILSVVFGWRKPHSSIYAEALRCFDIAPSSAVFVGDSFTADFLGPEAAGMTAYLIDPDRLHDVPEERRLTSLAELPGRLAR